MGSKPSEAERPAPANVKTVVVPRIPHDVIDEILGLPRYLFGLRIPPSMFSRIRSHGFRRASCTSSAPPSSLRGACPDGSKRSRRRRRVPLTTSGTCAFRSEGFSDFVPQTFFECIPWFTNAEKIYLLGTEPGDVSQVQIPSPWNPPPSVTSLTIETDMFTLVEIRDFMAVLPNLDDLSLSGCIGMDSRELLGIGMSLDLSERLGGKLVLHKVYHATKDVMDMLLGIPTGLRFTEVEFHSTRGCLLSVVRLGEACCKTLVELPYTVSVPGKSHPFFRSS